MYNHMDDARRAMIEQDNKTLAQIEPADRPRFGTLLIVAPPVHVPALNYPGATPAFQEKFADFMRFLDSHNIETNVAALRRSNNFAKVVLDRSEAGLHIVPGVNSDVDFRIWYQRVTGKTTWWMEGRSKSEVALKAGVEKGSPENTLALIAEVTARGEGN